MDDAILTSFFNSNMNDLKQLAICMADATLARFLQVTCIRLNREQTEVKIQTSLVIHWDQLGVCNHQYENCQEAG